MISPIAQHRLQIIAQHFDTPQRKFPSPRPATSRHLLLSATRDWIPLTGGAVKLRRPREAMPLTVWIALALMAIAAVAYLTGILIMEDILAFFSAKQ